MGSKALKNLTCLAFLLALILLGGTGYFLYREVAAMQQLSSWESHTYGVLRGFDSVLSGLQDAETGQRGYIITGDTSYLEPYDHAVRTLSGRLAQVRALTKDNEMQQERVHTLELLAQEKLRELHDTIETRKTEGRDISTRQVKSNHGQRLMDALRQVVAQAKNEEERLLRLRQAQRAASAARVNRAIFAGASVGFIMLFLAFVLLNKELVRRARAEAELEVQNARLKQIYEELQQETRERLQKERMLIQQSRMAAMGEMLNNIGHQWRQPLNVLGLTVQELLVMYELGQCDKDYLEKRVNRAKDLVQEMSRTIDHFWSFSQPDKEKTVFKAGDIVEKTLSIVGESLKENGVTLERDIPEDVEINGYVNEFAQVLLNILLNARDAFMEQKSPEARVELRSWMENGTAVVTITDNAGGIREEILPKIFDPYFTTKELGKGTGIGLFLSKRMIEEKMGGRLTACNVSGGAEFKIEV